MSEMVQHNDQRDEPEPILIDTTFPYIAPRSPCHNQH